MEAATIPASRDEGRGDGLRGQRPGESKLANIGISLPGTGETPVAPVYVDGEKTVTLKGERIAEDFQRIVDDYVAPRTAGKRAPRTSRRRSKTIAVKALNVSAPVARRHEPRAGARARRPKRLRRCAA
jgi:hypothetical protein